MGLLINLPVATKFMLVTMLVWVCVERFEASFLVGLYDIAKDAGDVGLCSCANPPCAVPFVEGLVGLVHTVAVILFDFYMTRGFATSMREEIGKTDAAVLVAQKIAAALAGYNIAAASEALAVPLPAQLRASFEALIVNLKAHEPYLPDSLLRGRTTLHPTPDGERHPPGGMQDSPEVAIVFTDIQSSTSLWEEYPQGMFDALRVHNQVIRGLYHSLHGYECKVIGDSFMLAFEEPLDAAQFGIKVQESLLDSKWPADLCTNHLCAPMFSGTQQLLWNGLRVRVGIHYGPVRCELNEIVGRMDYFGSTVNVAARIEGAVKRGGLTGITYAMLKEIRDDMDAIDDPAVSDMGEVTLKGVTGDVRYYVILSQRLAERNHDDTALREGHRRSLEGRPPGSAVRRRSLETLGWSMVSDTRGGIVPIQASSEWIGSPIGIRMVSDTRGGIVPIQASSEWIGSPIGIRTQMSTMLSSISSRQDSDRLLQSGLNDEPELSKSTVTCAMVRCTRGDTALERQITHIATVMSDLPMLDAVSTFADRTGGVVMCVFSTTCLVSWNASPPCKDHVAQCARFLEFSKGRIDAGIGVATSRALHGSMPAGRRRHMTVIGTVVDTALALVLETARTGDEALALGPVGELCGSHGAAFRAQIWRGLKGPPHVAWAVNIPAGGLTITETHHNFSSLEFVSDLFLSAVETGDFTTLEKYKSKDSGVEQTLQRRRAAGPQGLKRTVEFAIYRPREGLKTPSEECTMGLEKPF
eukprot:Hpha_TRINITY_DN10016_c0_g1::TRINITY_DN10016_c0_g1_i1::g.83938::m.83938